MLRPAMSDMLKNPQDYYTFVVSVAKRAREIAEEMESENYPEEKKDLKPVKLALEEFAQKAKEEA